MIGRDHLHCLKQLIDSLSRLGRNKKLLSIRHKGQHLIHLLLETIDCLIILLYRIPLVDGNHRCLSVIMGQSGNLSVLLGNAGRRVDHDDSHITSLHR